MDPREWIYRMQFRGRAREGQARREEEVPSPFLRVLGLVRAFSNSRALYHSRAC